MDLKKVFVIGTGGFVLVCLALFYFLINSTRMTGGRSQREISMELMESKLRKLEDAFESHKMSMKELEALALSQNSNNFLPRDEDNDIFDKDHKDPAHHQDNNNLLKPLPQSCSSSYGMKGAASSNINMLDVYNLLKFDNPDGGVWKQGFNIHPDPARFTPSDKLKVFIVPHSHNDPGWLKTFEKYYEDQTRHILDNMLVSLSSDPSLKFIWAEISYFNLWWGDLSPKEKAEVKTLVDNNQLEFVTGGWVMPDEANSHFYSILVQLTEGHQWLLKHLDYTPKNGWSIDPFGMSPTVAYILKRSGLSHMLIQRTHYAVKKHLAKLQELEFKWRQSWDSSGSTDIFCHMMPFYSYDVPHTCGPNPKICCQFDFKRMRPVSTMSCPWHVQPQPIIPQNVRERSLTLLDQYKRKAMLFKTNVLLIPLGDDFRWEDKPEWEAQVENYKKIMDWVNSHEELNAEIKWGTLDEYFRALEDRISPKGSFSPNPLSGDFFTYADRDDHYWSGYYTSRPFHKAMDRELIGHLKAAQILYTLTSAEVSKRVGDIGGNKFLRGLLGKLIQARRHLSLFQHHDGVTGTSKDHVMADYAQKLYSGLQSCNFVMSQSLHILTHLKGSSSPSDLSAVLLLTEQQNQEEQEQSESEPSYQPVTSKDHHSSLPHPNVIIVDKDLPDRLITVFNPSPHHKTQLVTIYVSTYLLKVVDIEGDPVESEVLPVFKDKTDLSSNTFQLLFVAKDLKPFSVKNFIVKHDPSSGSSTLQTSPEITVLNPTSPIFQNSRRFKIQDLSSSPAPIFLTNGPLTLNLSRDTGFPTSLKVNSKEYPWSIGMWKYGVHRRQETSGLYLFIPDGPATPLTPQKPFIRIIKGKLLSYAEIWLRQVRHRLTLYNYGPEGQGERYFVDIVNLLDIRMEENFELMMRFQTGIASTGVSYTDLNGFQMIQRRKFDKLPLQANYYPLPSATFIEDKQVRMTVLSRQPVGTASLNEGEVEVIMDRRLMQDDNRGVGQGDRDNLETVNAFRVIFEGVGCEDPDQSKKAPMLSLQAHLALQDLLHPFRAFFSPVELTPSALSSISDYSPSSNSKSSAAGMIACDIDLVDMTVLPTYKIPLDDGSYAPTMEASLTLRRLGIDGRFLTQGPQLKGCSLQESQLGKFSLSTLFGDSSLFTPHMKQMTLSFIHEGKSIPYNESILLKPMEIYAFKTFFIKG